MRFYNLAGASAALPIVPAPFVYLRGYSIRESSGSAIAVLRIFDSNATNGATGTILDEIELPANGVLSENYGIAKVAHIGLYVAYVSGAAVGSIHFD